MGAQCFSGWVLDSRPRGRGFRPHRRHCVVSLGKNSIATKVVCFSRLLKCLIFLYGKQCGPRSDCTWGAVWSGSTLFPSIINWSVMLGNYLQQTTSAGDIFRCIFGALRVNTGSTQEDPSLYNWKIVDGT